MSVEQSVIEAARQVGAAENVPSAVLLAVAIVETNARAFAVVGARREPIVRFEGHYFDRRLEGEKRRIARLAGLAHPKAGRVRNAAGQAARWAMLERALAIDEAAAIESTSFGLAQVMGAHWRALGFTSARALADLARASEGGQLAIGARFLRHAGLETRLPDGDFVGFARAYNGPGFRANGYDRKIADGYRRARRLLAEDGHGTEALPERGEAASALQRALVRHGFPVAVDGIAGPRTRAALEAFRARFGASVSPLAV